MLGNMLNDLAEAMRRWTEKNGLCRSLDKLQSRSLSGRHVSTSFLDPVLGAMMKQVCWHSRRSKAYRGLPEGCMAASRLLHMC